MNESFNPFEALFKRLTNIEALLIHGSGSDESIEYMTISKASEFIGKTDNALRVMVHKNQLPHIKKQGKLFFRKSDLVAWFESGSVDSNPAPENILFKNIGGIKK